MERESISLEHVSEECTCIGRKCPTCQQVLCFGRFTKNKKEKDGLCYQCRACKSKAHAAWHEKNREKQRGYHATWYEKNRERRREYNAAWRMKRRNGAASRKDVQYWPFEQSRAFVHELGLKNREEWSVYSKSAQKPTSLPAAPRTVYNREWHGWGDFLGTGTIATFQRVYLSFEQARSYVHRLALSNLRDWQRYCRSGARPPNIPARPDKTYWEEWNGMGDWLGNGRRRRFIRRGRAFWPFEQARAYVQRLGIKSCMEWKAYCHSGLKPVHIPYQPGQFYAQEWHGWGDWLGTGAIATFQRKYWGFEQAQAHVQNLGIKGWKDWERYQQSGERNTYIPCRPDLTYKTVWKSMDDWLGKRRAMAEKTALQPREPALSGLDGRMYPSPEIGL